MIICLVVMKNLFANLFLSMVSGAAGAWLFQQYAPPAWKEQATTQEVFLAENKERESVFTAFNDQPAPAASSVSTWKDDLRVSFAEASAVSTKSVVYIKTIDDRSYDRLTWFDLFFNNRGGGRERGATGSGSGVILSSDGYIVTNNHVIDGSSNIEVVIGKETYQAAIIGTDPSTDLALLKVEAANLPAISVVSAKNLQVGDWVLAVGNPFNLTSTVTAGIVSAKGRRINVLKDIFPIESFIQTDAAINPGNSGGALVNSKGELVGINTAILSRTGSYTGYGFAVPSDIVMKVVNDLKLYGEAQRAFMGIEIEDINSQTRDKMGLKNLDGVVVTSVVQNSAADKADLKRGDVLLSMSGTEIDSKAAYDEKMSFFTPGEKALVRFRRGDKVMEKEVVLTNIEGTTDILRKMSYKATALGAVFETLSAVEKARLGIKSGVKVRQVNKGLIQDMGIRDGYIVLSINGTPIDDPQMLSEVLGSIKGVVLVDMVNREGYLRRYKYYF